MASKNRKLTDDLTLIFLDFKIEKNIILHANFTSAYSSEKNITK